MERGKLIVVSAPSGCGKGTILAEVLRDPKFYFSVSCTTRAPRPGEVDGVNYNFITKERFEALIAEGAFLEHAEYVGNYYGTLLAPIEENLARGKDVLLEIEVRGAEQIRALRPDASLVFIVPPSLEVLRERLMNRGTEAAEVIDKRVAQAEQEISCRERYDYCLVNDKPEDAVADFKAIVRAIELKVEK
ncbi:MAG: guanylate kinase [Oscillospiraceae bacterium]|nr:guanylate kinase [Oscillospiraceae bacterium]